MTRTAAISAPGITIGKKAQTAIGATAPITRMNSS